MKILQIIKRTIYSIFILLFLINCEKEDSCSGDEPFIEPTWMKEIQTELENDSFICFADMSLFLRNGNYYIYQRTSYDTSVIETRILYNCRGQVLQSGNKYSSEFLEEAEALENLFSYVNEACIWKSDFNKDCLPLETNPQKIITGRWRLTKSLNRTYKGITIYYSVPYLWWLEFNSNGSIIREYYDPNNEFIKDEGTFIIDSLLRFTNIGERNLIYEFSYCNNSMKLTTTMGFDEQQFIYERQ